MNSTRFLQERWAKGQEGNKHPRLIEHEQERGKQSVSSVPMHPSGSQGETTHPRWRVILVGRTGLDQILRRDGSIELIRARDTIDAIGELSDPIDADSPAQAVVLVGASTEPSGNELARFLTGLRLIDPDVRVLRVGSYSSQCDLYDGWIDSQSGLSEILDAINQSNPTETETTLKFVDAIGRTSPEPSNESEAAKSKANMSSEEKIEVVVVARNEDFEHRSQVPFEEESQIHQHVLMGGDLEDLPKPNIQATESAIAPQAETIRGPHDDQPLVEAMLSGRSVIEPAIKRINTRLERDDITLITDTETAGVPVMIGGREVGKLVCADHKWAMGEGHDLLSHQSQWLSKWIKLDIQQGELRNAAFTDSLTGAWNRRYFTRFLDAAISQARNARQPLSVMLFDIDGFKHYNDAYGHGAGDEILIESVKLLKSVIRPSDRVCRVGGDEFAVIFYEPSGPRDPESKPLESVFQIATRFQKQICMHRFPKLASEAQGTLTVSAGLASFPWDGHNSESLLEQADLLALESKNQGKNAITLGPGAETVCKTGH